jgi:N-acetylglutamate synthase-like GNAT family acetyltransferase
MYKVKLANTQNVINRIIDLRYIVLRKPWNKTIETATDDFELTSINAYIEYNNEVIACGRLQDNGKGIGQVRYMAVHPDYQGKGLGKLIMTALEEEAKKINLTSVELQARENAVEFYKSQCYSIKEPSFKLWDIIQHYLMVKEIK